MTTGNKVIIAGIVLVAVFLLGFAPQYMARRELRGDLATASDRIDTYEWNARYHRLFELAALMQLEASALNYGLANQHAAAYFAQAEELAAGARTAEAREELDRILTRRDEIMGPLARGDAAVLPELQQLVRETRNIVERRVER